MASRKKQTRGGGPAAKRSAAAQGPPAPRTDTPDLHGAGAESGAEVDAVAGEVDPAAEPSDADTSQAEAPATDATDGGTAADLADAEQSAADAEQSAAGAELTADGGGDEAGEPGTAGEAPGGTARSRPRLTAASAVVALLLALLGFTFVVQVRSVATDPTLAAAREEDLVRILADLDAHEERLRQDIRELEETLSRLTSADASQQEALEEAARRADELGILSGTLPATGPGLSMRVRTGAEPITAAVLLDAVQEMRGAGAEAIQITDESGGEVRVVASTWFLDHEQGILVDGELLRSPYTLTVIGDPDTIRPAMTIPGGVVEKVHGLGGTVTMHEEPAGVEVTVVREPATLQHARPVS